MKKRRFLRGYMLFLLVFCLGICGSVTVHAAAKYTVKFLPNGGKGTVQKMTCTAGKAQTLKKNGFQRTGYRFAGWNTKANGTGRSYADRQTVTDLTKKKNGVVKLYAQWKANTYTIRFDANGGVGNVQSISCKYGKKYTLPLCDFVRENYHFDGWSRNKNGTGKRYEFLQRVSNLASKNGKTVTLYAVWKKFTSEELQKARRIVEMVNTQRAAYGLKKLSVDSALTGIAQQRAYETVFYWDHTRPDGKSSCFTLFENSGYSCRAAGENIAYGNVSTEMIMNGWMNSPGHRANILSANYTKIGVGCYYYNGYYYWTQNFSG